MLRHAARAQRMTGTRRMRLFRRALAIGVTSVLLSACAGTTKGAASTAAQKASQKISKAVTQTESVTAPAKPEPGTKTSGGSKPEAPRTTTKTRTVTASATKPDGVTVHNSKSLKLNATQISSAKSSTGGGGLPWWAWVLIGAAAVAVLVAIFAAGRRRGRSTPPRPHRMSAGATRRVQGRRPVPVRRRVRTRRRRRTQAHRHRIPHRRPTFDDHVDKPALAAVVTRGVRRRAGRRSSLTAEKIAETDARRHTSRRAVGLWPHPDRMIGDEHNRA